MMSTNGWPTLQNGQVMINGSSEWRNYGKGSRRSDGIIGMERAL